MTSDAKIGLLLGLVFIFIIAFVINGLPGLHNKDDGNTLTKNMVGLQNSQTGLGANERKLVLEATPGAAQPVENASPSPEQAGDSDDIRFSMALPEGTPTTTDATASSKAVTEPVTVPVDSTVPVQPATAKVHVVQDGDTLGSIAKSVYGPVEGNKLATINAIFEANRKILASADSLQVGQKLTIPPLSGSNVSSQTPANVLSGRDFTKAESVGKRHLTAGADTTAASDKANSSKSARIYVVKEGDSLWRIAANQLGDGNRYKEIVRLNSNKLSSEDDIQVAMQLRMPAK
ncbi:MAG: LysM peptidoglycan-binding domain-containing protein [Sedimentisphaerales bacterium]|nr:LysM peptidoglycan-binding domain-containing protein [Sedimentisphaerales bacterium]